MNFRIRNNLLKSLILSAMVLSTAPASAIEVLDLKSHVDVTGDIVTLGDIFPNARKYRAAPLFKSPALGREGSIAISYLIDAAERYGFTFETPTDLKTITVSRPGRTIKSATFRKLLENRLTRDIQKTDKQVIELKTIKPLADQMVPLHFSGELKLIKFSYNKANKRFSALFSPKETVGGAHNQIRFQRRINGKASISFLRPVLTRPIKRGENITRKDIELKPFSQYRIPKTAVKDMALIIGKTATGNLRQGAFINSRDLETTRIISKNQLVTLVFSKAGLSLKTQGKAMADGGMNDSIAVMNIHSKRIVHGTVQAPGVVIIQNAELARNRRTAELQY